MILRAEVYLKNANTQESEARTITISDQVKRHTKAEEVDEIITEWRKVDPTAAEQLGILETAIVPNVKVVKADRTVVYPGAVLEMFTPVTEETTPEPEPEPEPEESNVAKFPGNGEEEEVTRAVVVERKEVEDLSPAEIARMQDSVGVTRRYFAAVADREALKKKHSGEMGLANAQVKEAEGLLKAALEEIDEESRQPRLDYSGDRAESRQNVQEESPTENTDPAPNNEQAETPQPEPEERTVDCDVCGAQGFMDGKPCPACQGACVVEKDVVSSE